MTSQNFESSFSQILNRTQQNLNRINQRYASVGGTSSSGPSLTSSFSNLPVSSSQTGTIGNSLLKSSEGFPTAGRSMPAASTSQINLNPALLNRSSSLPSSGPNALNRSSSNPPKGGITIEEDVLQAILQRLTYLEKTVEDHQQYSLQISANEKLSKSVDQNVNDVLLEMKDIHRQFSQQQNRITVLQSLCDSLTLEQEQRKLSSLKMENWMRETESWREEVSSLLSAVKRQETLSSKSQSEIRQLLSESYLSKTEFETFRDKVYLLSQQSVASALSAWNDSNELKLKQLERELAVLKLSQTKAVQQEIQELSKQNVSGKALDPSEDLANADLVARVLNTPIPSEMVIKGAVSSEVRNLETALESKLENRLTNLLTNQLQQSKQALVNHINHQVLSICTDSLLYSDLTTAAARPPPPAASSAIASSTGAGLSHLNLNQMLQLNNSLLSSLNPSGSGEEKQASTTAATTGGGAPPMSDEQLRMEFERRVMTGKHKMENLERKFLEKLGSMEKSLLLLQEKTEFNDKDLLVKVVQMETKIDNHQEMMNQQLLQSNSKFQSMEMMFKEQEVKWKDSLEKHQQSATEKLHSMNSEFMNERLSLEKRLIIVERIAQDSLETMKRSQEILHQSILSHPTILQLNSSLKDLQSLSQEMTSLKQSLHEVQNDCFKLQSTTVSMTDFLFYKEKLIKCDHFIQDTLPEYLESIKKLLEFHTLMTTKQEQVDYLLTRMNTETLGMNNKIDALQLQSIQAQGNITTMLEETKLLKTRVGTMETSNQKELNGLKDLTGSLASRLQSNENKILTMNRTQAAETTSILQQIKLLEEKVEFYEKLVSSVPRYTTATTTTTSSMSPPPPPSSSSGESQLAMLGKNTSTINVAPLTLLSSSPIPLSMTSSSTSNTAPNKNTITSNSATQEANQPPSSVATTAISKEEAALPGPREALTETKLTDRPKVEEEEEKKIKPKMIVKQELRGVPPVLVSVEVPEEEQEEEDAVQSFAPLAETSFDLPPSQQQSQAQLQQNKRFIAPLPGSQLPPPPGSTSMSSILPETSSTAIAAASAQYSSSSSAAAALSQQDISTSSDQSSLLNSMSLMSNHPPPSGSNTAPAAVSSISLQKPRAPEGKVPNEWDEDSFDSPVAVPTEKSSNRNSSEILEDSFAPTEEEDDDEQLMTSLPAGMTAESSGHSKSTSSTSTSGPSSHLAQKKRESEEDLAPNKEEGDESDDDFDQLTEQISAMKQFNDQNLSKYSTTNTATAGRSQKEDNKARPEEISSSSFLENSFDESSFASETSSPVKYQPSTTSTSATIAAREELLKSNNDKKNLPAEEGEEEFEEDVDSVLQLPPTPQRITASQTTHSNASKSTAAAVVPPLSLSSLHSEKKETISEPQPLFSRDRAIEEEEDESELDSVTHSPTKPSFQTSKSLSKQEEEGNLEMSDWDASLDTSRLLTMTNTTIAPPSSSLDNNNTSDSNNPAPANTSSSSASASKDPSSFSSSSQSYLSNSFDQSSSLLNASPSKTEAKSAVRPVTGVPPLPLSGLQKDPSATTTTTAVMVNSFDEPSSSSADLSMERPAISSSNYNKTEKLSVDTKEVIPASSSSSSVQPSPVLPTTTSATGGSVSKDSIKERLRARQEALKQQRQSTTTQSSSSSTPMRSRASSPPPSATNTTTTSTAMASNMTAATATTSVGLASKKTSFLDTLNDDEDSFSSESAASKQPTSTLKAASATAVSSTALSQQQQQSKKAATTVAATPATDEIQAFEEIDDSSFDF